MSECRKITVLVLEGFIETGQKTKVVWQDHLWNTGEKTRTWLVEPSSVRSFVVKERKHRPARDH